MSEETITITLEEYKELKEDQDFLYALEAAGVNNWEGYEIALESYNELE